jgi:glycosyltransferase involved in cell wall biosynthesis
MVSVGSDRPIRVLHMGSPTGLYGAERWILALIKHLPPEQVDSWVGVVKDAPELEAPLCAVAAKMGFRTRVFESYGKFSRSAIGQLRQFLLEHEIDILHTHGYKTDLIGCLAVRGTSCRIIATPHGWSVNAGFKLQIYEMLDRVAFLFMDAIAPLSQDLCDGLRRLPGLRKKLRLIDNGVDLSEVDAPIETPELVRRWRSESRFIIGYIGQLITRKRIDSLIEAFHQLDLPAKQLCLIGDGPQRAQLKALAERLGERDSIAFLGFRDDRIAFLKGFDLFVLPSELEGIPRSLMEATGAAIPAIATDIPGCRDVVLPGKTGLLCVPGDAEDLHRQMSRMIQDEALRTQLARAGAERTRERYSAQAMARRYAGLYREQHSARTARVRVGEAA